MIRLFIIHILLVTSLMRGPGTEMSELADIHAGPDTYYTVLDQGWIKTRCSCDPASEQVQHIFNRVLISHYIDQQLIY